VHSEVREAARKFAEVYVKATLVTCLQRDAKGMYPKAMAGEIRGFTGIDEPYEPPLCPELILETETDPPEVCAERMIATLELMGYSECQFDFGGSTRVTAGASTAAQLIKIRRFDAFIFPGAPLFPAVLRRVGVWSFTQCAGIPRVGLNQSLRDR
jgi:adenylylsulfate kinase